MVVPKLFAATHSSACCATTQAISRRNQDANLRCLYTAALTKILWSFAILSRGLSWIPHKSRPSIQQTHSSSQAPLPPPYLNATHRVKCHQLIHSNSRHSLVDPLATRTAF